MKIAVVAAAGLRGELGRNGELPWKIKEDLEFFKNLTTGQVVVMGRKTYDSIGKALPNRTVVVLTTKENYELKDAIVMHSVGEVMKFAHENDLETLYIAGGGEMYRHFLPLAEQLYLTVVDAKFDADVYFPQVNQNEWELIHEKPMANGDYDFTFNYFERKQGQS
jgi:dihydrofolate reductase